MSLPGTWLLAQARKYLNKDLFDSAVAPTLADMQFEVQAAPTTRLRWLALVRGYSASARLLFLHGFIWSSPMRRPLIVLALGVVGSAVLMTVWSLAPRGPAFCRRVLLDGGSGPDCPASPAGGHQLRTDVCRLHGPRDDHGHRPTYS